jgi:MFS family permease
LNGFILKKTKKNRLLLRICCVGTLLALALTFYTLQQPFMWLIYLNIFLIGFLMVPIIPIGINFASELTFPQEPTVVTGFVLMAGSTMGFILGVVNSILAEIDPLYAIALMTGNVFIASILSIIIKEDLKKFNYSQQQSGLLRT